MEKIEFWVKPEVVNKLDFVKANKAFTNKIKGKSADEISTKYSYFNLTEHLTFVSEVFNKLNINLYGTGVEVGAGPAIFSNSVIRLFPNIDKIYAIEISPDVIELQKLICQKLNTCNKIRHVVGDFNDMKLEDNSLDFILDFDSIHHSDDMSSTFKQISKKLKKNGVLICFDRGMPNHVPKKQIDYLLNIEYNDEYKLENGLPLHKSYKRFMAGEHEPYIRDWENLANKNNLDLNIYIFTKKKLWSFLKLLFGLIPFTIRDLIGKGKNLNTHIPLLVNYFFNINISSKLTVFNLNSKLKSKKIPLSKMVFFAKKR